MKTDANEKWVVCRVCLKNPSESGSDEGALQTIFSQSASDRLDQMLHICAGIPVSIDDHFPDKMCSKCVRCLRLAYKFRLTCQRSHQYIADMLAKEIEARGAPEASAISGSLDDYSDTIVQIWENEDVGKPVKLEAEEADEEGRVISYVIADDGQESMVYEEFIDEGDSEVVYEENPQIVAEEETETYAEYEELEILSSETAPATEQEEVAVVEAAEDQPENLGDEDPEQSSDNDDRTYVPEGIRPKIRILNRSGQRAQGGAKAKGTQPPGEEKRKGRKPRDKNSNYICDVCGNIYPSQARLTEHMKFHSGKKPHECEICGRGFVQNQQLVRHMNTHTGNRPYKCNFCPAAFADRSTKTKHHRIHTQERPYECDVCHKTFTYSDNLKFHKMIHTGEKPHACDLCGKGFVKAYKMRLHRTTHEKRDWKNAASSQGFDEVKSEYIEG